MNLYLPLSFDSSVEFVIKTAFVSEQIRAQVWNLVKVIFNIIKLNIFTYMISQW